MKIEIRHTDQVQGPIRGAILRGATVEDWLLEMRGWNMHISDLECYLIPTSLENRKAMGLFVIFPANENVIPKLIRQPYRMLGERLMLPQKSVLWPAMLSSEISNIWPYQRQLFHPNIGLIGFEETDRVDFGQILLPPLPSGKQWNLAQDGNPEAMPMLGAEIESRSMAEMLEALKKEIDPKSLDELPESKRPKEEPGEEGSFMSGLLGGARSITQGVMGALPEAGEGEVAGGLFNMLSKLDGWLGEKENDIHQKREDELERLMKLFEENPDEALRYALPLDSPFLGRGDSGQSSRLGRRDIGFNFGNIGGGVGGDAWEIEASFYQKLREKYTKAAQAAIDRKDFNRAAYVYAHLLHDFNAAANVLEQGKMFREAALVYREQLKDLNAAAQCLERGGLFAEAAEIHLELNRWEYAADLYAKIGLRKKSDALYERCVEDAIKRNAYRDAARLVGGKLGDSKRETDILLEGWKVSPNQQACLGVLFEKVLAQPDVEKLDYLQDFYENEVAATQTSKFLNVLVSQKAQWEQEGASELMQGFTYEIVSKDIEKGRIESIYFLNKLLPDDPLMNNDVVRYRTLQRRLPKQPPTKITKLDGRVKWVGVKPFGRSYIAWGLDGMTVKVVRFNARKTQYISFPTPVADARGLEVILPPFQEGKSQKGLLISAHFLGFKGYKFDADKDLGPAVSLKGPHWLSLNPRLIGIGMDADENVYALKESGRGLTHGKYDYAGVLGWQMDIFPEETWKFPNTEGMLLYGRDLFISNEIELLKIKEFREASVYDNYDDRIYNMVVGPIGGREYLVLVRGNSIKGYEDNLENALIEYQLNTINEFEKMHLGFVADGELAIVQENSILIISLGGEKIAEMHINHPNGRQTVGILSGLERNQFRLLQANGEILEFKI